MGSTSDPSGGRRWPKRNLASSAIKGLSSTPIWVRAHARTVSSRARPPTGITRAATTASRTRTASSVDSPPTLITAATPPGSSRSPAPKAMTKGSAVR